MKVFCRYNDKCPKCHSSFLTPIYNWFVDLVWAQCKCGFGQWMKPAEQDQNK